MNHIKNLSFSKDFFFKSERCKKISSLSNSAIMHEQELESVTRAKKALLSPKQALQTLTNVEALREAVAINAERTEALQTNLNNSELPTFHQANEEEQYTDIGMPLSEVAAMFARKAKSVYESLLISDRGQITLQKASEYQIPYDPSNINFLELFDQVEEFETVIARAKEFGIDWQDFGYDIIAIEQEMLEIAEEERGYRKSSYLDFVVTRGLEA